MRFYTFVGMFLLSLFVVVPSGLLVLWMYETGTPERVDYQEFSSLGSPDGRWVVTMRDRRHEYGLFPMVTFVTELRLARAGGAGRPVDLVVSDTEMESALRPQLRWMGVDRLCVVTPRIDAMSVHAGEIEGVKVDIHVLPWSQEWPPPKIDLDAVCR